MPAENKPLTAFVCGPGDKACPDMDHDFPTDEHGQIDQYAARCTKCGMSFQQHIHTEMP